MSNNLVAQPLDTVEKIFAKSFFDYMLDYEKFSTNYRRLLEGLSEEQQHFLIYTFSRIIFVCHSQFFLPANFTEEEISAQNDVFQNFSSRIVNNGNYHSYKDYNLPREVFEASLFYYELGINNIKNKAKLNGTDFIDAGAYIGDSALVLDKLYPDRIFAFEPVNETFQLLQETISINNMQDIIYPVQIGLDSFSGSRELGLNGASTSAFLAENFSHIIPKETIRVETLDNFVESNNLNVGLIKIDVEGLELDVLKGAERTIRKFKPVIIASIYHNAEEFFEVKPMLEDWEPGYRFYFDKLNPHRFLNEINVICEVY